jgi:phosphomannomutase/phosphoglucomutase
MTHGFSVPSFIPPSIFRAYDIRGIVDDFLTEDIVYAIALAIGSEALERNEHKIIVARDGRLSGPKLFAALCEGLLTTGCDVIDIGMVPTPAFYFATYHLGFHSGVILTGSHNPANYNGLKIILEGKSLTEERVQALRDRILTDRLFIQSNKNKKGKLTQEKILEDYKARILTDVKLKTPLKVVIDCGNGIGGCVAPDLFRSLGCEVIELYCEVDGHFPNHHPDPSQTNNLIDLIAAVQLERADIGLAFDGDADRLGVVTNKGEIIWPDRLLMLYAIDVLERMPGSEIVFDVKCSRHLPEVIVSFGGKPLMWKTGHSLIKSQMRERGAVLAGEMSGHIFFKERWYGFDDGLYAAARLLEIVAARQETISEIFMALPNSINTPELKLAIADEDKFNFITQLIDRAKFIDANLNTIDGLRIDFPDGWGLVRASNTTACLTLRFEADNSIALERIQIIFRKLLLSINSELCLPF